MKPPNKKIKIVYQTLPHIVGGTERFLFNLIRYMDKRKFEPVILSYGRGRVTSLFKLLGIRIEVINSKSPQAFKNLAAILKEWKIDIAQSSHYYPMLAVSARIAGVPHIWRPGGNIHIAHPEFGLEKRKYFLNILSFLSTKIVCPVTFLKGQFKNVRESKIEIIYNGVNPVEINKISPDYTILRKYGCDDNCFAIAMVAYLVPQKRHIDFIRAAKIVKKYIPHTKFFIFGEAYPSKKSLKYAEYLYETVKESHMDKDIIFTGFYKDILKIMKGMRLIILPSIDEGASNAIMEAMALGKPLIASDSGGNRELVKNGQSGYLVPPKNPTRLAEAIIDVIKSPQKSRLMGKAGKERAKRLFNIKDSVRRFEDLYLMLYSK